MSLFMCGALSSIWTRISVLMVIVERFCVTRVIVLIYCNGGSYVNATLPKFGSLASLSGSEKPCSGQNKSCTCAVPDIVSVYVHCSKLSDDGPGWSGNCNVPDGFGVLFKDGMVTA